MEAERSPRLFGPLWRADVEEDQGRQMGRHELAGSVSRAHSLRSALDDLAELISRAWAEYELRAAALRRPVGAPAVDEIFSQVPKVPTSAAPASAAEIPGNRKYQQSTERMLRRIDALLGPYTTDGEAPPSKH